MDKGQLRQFPHLRQRKLTTETTHRRIIFRGIILTPCGETLQEQALWEPSAFESEILPLHKSAIYDKEAFRPPGARKREEVISCPGILLSER